MGYVGKWFIYVVIVILLVGCQFFVLLLVVEQLLKEQLVRQIVYEQVSQNLLVMVEGLLELVLKNVFDLFSEVLVSGQFVFLFGLEKYDIEVDGVVVRVFFVGLMVDMLYSVVIYFEVSGEILFSLKQVSMEQVMELFGDFYGYDISCKSNVYCILLVGMCIEIFVVNYLFMICDGFI